MAHHSGTYGALTVWLPWQLVAVFIEVQGEWRRVSMFIIANQEHSSILSFRSRFELTGTGIALSTGGCVIAAEKVLQSSGHGPSSGTYGAFTVWLP